MALIEAEPRGKLSRIVIQVPAEMREQLRAYCEYSGNRGTEGEQRVLRGALKVLFGADKDFGPWLQKQAKEAAAAKSKGNGNGGVDIDNGGAISAPPSMLPGSGYGSSAA